MENAREKGVQGMFLTGATVNDCKIALVQCHLWFEMKKMNAGFVYVWRTFGISLCG